MGEYQECSHEGGYRWLDCIECSDKGITCQERVCVDCGASEPE